MDNQLFVSLSEMKVALKPFSKKRLKLGSALLAFEGGFLSIESGEITAVMRAEGDWNGRVRFSGELVRALATFPPACDPVRISYADDHLLFGPMTIPCSFERQITNVARTIENPTLIDLVALSRSLPRAEAKASLIGQRSADAMKQVDVAIKKAAKLLSGLGIEGAELRGLFEKKISARIESDQQQSANRNLTSSPKASIQVPDEEMWIVERFITLIEERVRMDLQLCPNPSNRVQGLLSLLYALKQLPRYCPFVNVTISASERSENYNFDLGLEYREGSLLFSAFDFGTTTFVLIYNNSGVDCRDFFETLVGDKKYERVELLIERFEEFLFDGEREISVENHSEPSFIFAELMGIPRFDSAASDDLDTRG